MRETSMIFCMRWIWYRIEQAISYEFHREFYTHIAEPHGQP
jgi:hypothetical protein